MLQGLPYRVLEEVKIPLTWWQGPRKVDLYLVNELHEWKAVLPWLKKQKILAVDTETTGLEWIKPEVKACGFSMGWGTSHFYIPVRHEVSLGDPTPIVQIDIKDIRQDLIDLLGNPELTTVFHNSKFDLKILHKEGIEVNGSIHDTMELWKIWNENAPAGLKSVCSGYTSKDGTKFEGLVGPECAVGEKALNDYLIAEAKRRKAYVSDAIKKEVEEAKTNLLYQGMKKNEIKKAVKEKYKNHPWAKAVKKDIKYSEVSLPIIARYAALDTALTYFIFSDILPKVKADPGLWRTYKQDKALIKISNQVELLGVQVDRPYLEQLRKKYIEKLEELTNKIAEDLGETNIKSPIQLVAKLEELGLEWDDTTKKGGKAVDAKVLQKLSDKHQAVANILEFRKYSKLQDTYVEGILDKLDPNDMLHTNFNLNVSTGRMSALNPNLQNVPAKANDIRTAFIPPKIYINVLGRYLYICVDYSQQELRVTAHYSQDPTLISAYRKGLDVHTETARKLFGVDYVVMVKGLEDPTHADYKKYKSYRNVAKTLNFAIIYGAGPKGLAEQIPRPDQYKKLSFDQWVQQCTKFLDDYFRNVPGVKFFIEECAETVWKEHQIRNYFGRLRRFPELEFCKKHHKAVKKGLADPYVKKMYYAIWSRVQRQAPNYVIQGTSADVMKTSAVRIDKILKGSQSRQALWIHDEAQLYIHEKDEHLLQDVKHAMMNFPFTIPLEVEFSLCEGNWANKVKLEV